VHVDATAENINLLINYFRSKTMPLIDIHVIENVFNPAQKKEIIEKITDTMVQIEGEALRGVTWVRIKETNEGDWAIGGQQLTAAAIHAMQQG
jgi:4-oxalocrotonate tautomerase